MSTIPSVTVVKLVQEWRFSPAIEGNGTGFRRYIEVSGSHNLPAYAGEPAPTSRPLPGFGSAWGLGYEHLMLTRMEVKRPNDDDNAPRIFDCYYESKWIHTQDLTNDGVTFGPGDDTWPLEMSCESTVESITLEPTTEGGFEKYKWYYTPGTPDVEQAVSYQITLVSMKIYRNVMDIGQFIASTRSMLGKVNANVFYDGVFPIGTCLYQGFSATPFIDESDRKKWRLELNFTARFVTYDIGSGGVGSPGKDGWNFVLNQHRQNATDPIWDAPYTVDNSTTPPTNRYLYEFADFEAGGGIGLFSSSMEDAFTPDINAVTE